MKLNSKYLLLRKGGGHTGDLLSLGVGMVGVSRHQARLHAGYALTWLFGSLIVAGGAVSMSSTGIFRKPVLPGGYRFGTAVVDCYAKASDTV